MKRSLPSNRRLYQSAEAGCSKPRVFHRKRVKVKCARYLIKCGDCDEKVQIYYGEDSLEINGVLASIEDWRQILLPLLLVESYESAARTNELDAVGGKGAKKVKSRGGVANASRKRRSIKKKSTT